MTPVVIKISYTIFIFLLTAGFYLSAMEQTPNLVSRIQEELPNVRVIQKNKVEFTQDNNGNKQEIGKGAFGKVYKAKWQKNDTDLLVFKEINPDEARANLYGQGNKLVRLEDIEELIVWEVVRSAQLDHPNIMEFEGICQKDGAFYIVSKFYNRGNLQENLKKTDAIPLAQCAKWAIEITHGLAYLHQQGIVHRDLKADNIFIDQYGRARLGDFGVVQADSLIDETSPTVVNMGVQSRRFKAPESVINWEYSSKATDVYALGLVFWQLINHGENPQYTYKWIKDWCETFRQYYKYAHDVYVCSKSLLDLETMKALPKNLNYVMQKADDTIAPFKDMEVTDKNKVLKTLRQSVDRPTRETIPGDCPTQLKNLILQCWANDPQQRPSLQYIEDILYSLLGMNTTDYYVAILKACITLENHIQFQSKAMHFYVPISLTDEKQLKEIVGESKKQNVARADDATNLIKLYYTPIVDIPFCLETDSEKWPFTPTIKRFEKFLMEEQQSVLILLGEAGLGKTLSTYKFADQLLKEWWKYLDFKSTDSTERAPSHFPILIRWCDTELENAIAKALECYASTGYLEVFKTYLINATDPLIIIDGYDECKHNTQQLLINCLQWLGTEYPRAKLIVTNRLKQESDLDTLKKQWRIGEKGDPQIYHALPLTKKQIKSYLYDRSNFWEDELSTYVEKIQNSFELSAVQNSFFFTFRNPLGLSIFSNNLKALHQQELGASNQCQQKQQLYSLLIKNTFERYKNFLTLSLVSNDFKNRSLEDFQDFAAKVAKANFEEKEPLSEQFWPLDDVIIEASAQQYDQKQSTNRSYLTKDDYQSLILLQYNEHLRSLPVRKRAGGKYEFIHASFYEYFVAHDRRRLNEGAFSDYPWDCFYILNNFLSKTSPSFLDLDYHRISDNHAGLIATLLKDNKTLKVLSLNCTQITYNGAKAIAQALAPSESTILETLIFRPEVFLVGEPNLQDTKAKAEAFRKKFLKDIGFKTGPVFYYFRR